MLALEDDQFAYGGKTYRSLTVIAQQITGAHWSGPRFFGLKVGRGSLDGCTSYNSALRHLHPEVVG